MEIPYCHISEGLFQTTMCTAAVADDCVEVTIREAKYCEYDTIMTDNSKAGREMDNYYVAPHHMPLKAEKHVLNDILKRYNTEEAEMGDHFAPAHTPSAAKNCEFDIDIIVKPDDMKEQEHTTPRIPSIPGQLLIPLTKGTKQIRFFQESASNTGLSNRMQELEDIERALRGVAKARRAIDLHLQMASTFNDNTHSASTCTTTPNTSTSIRPRSIPLTIFALSEVSLSITEKAGQRLYKQAVERRQKLAQKQLEAKRKPKEIKTKKLERKKVEGRKSLPLQKKNAKVAAKKYHNADSIVTFSQCSSESSEGTGQDDSVFVKDTTNHKNSSLDNRKQGKTRLQTGTGSGTKVVSGNSKISPKRDLDLVGTSDVLSFYHSIHAQSHIQSVSEQCTSNHRLLYVNKAVTKCLDQLTKMEMKTRNGHPGKLYRCKFTEAAEKWLAVE